MGNRTSRLVVGLALAALAIVLTTIFAWAIVGKHRLDPEARFVFTEFAWDEGNVDHLWERHRVSPEEVEELFAGAFQWRKGRTVKGVLYHVGLGQTQTGRYLTVIFQIKKPCTVRVASSRPMSRAERKWYDKALGS